MDKQDLHGARVEWTLGLKRVAISETPSHKLLGTRGQRDRSQYMKLVPTNLLSYMCISIVISVCAGYMCFVKL